MTNIISKPLYKWAITLDFYPDSHQYRINGDRIPSVTGICGIVDKSNQLIMWAVKLYKEYLLQHETITTSIVEEWSKRRREVSKEATDIGTIVHDYCEWFACGVDMPMPDIPQALNGIQWFLSRYREHNIKFLHTERLIYSKKHNYCGKFDALIERDGKKCLVDFKTSKGFYPLEMGMQLAAYRAAYEEEMGEAIDAQYILRFDKETGNFEIHACPDHDKDFEAFLAALILTKRKKETDKFSRDLI